MPKIKYKTVYPKHFQADLPANYKFVIWIKDKSGAKIDHRGKKVMNFLSCKSPENFNPSSHHTYQKDLRFFCLMGFKIYLSSFPDNKTPRRLLIKYV